MSAYRPNQPVTVAIPFFNAESFLADAIRSIFAQTHTNWELLLIDDGSTDSSLEIACSVIDPRVRVISDGLNLRLAARLNQVPEMAKYDLIARMDADDLISPVRLETQVRILNENPAVDITSSGLYSVLDDCSLVGIRGNSETCITSDDLLRKRKGILHAGAMFRKSWCLRNHYDASIPVGQDVELWLRAAGNNDFNVLTVSTPLYIYREAGNVTKDKLLRAFRLERHIFSGYIKSPISRFLYLLKSYGKSSVVHVLGALRLLWLLQKKRNAAVSDNDRNEYARILGIIRNTAVPGMNQPSNIPEKI